MTITRYDAMFYACVVAAWFIIGDVDLWQIICLSVLFVLMNLAGDRKEAARVRNIIKGSAL